MADVSRWAVKLEFDGSAYVGWQRQDNGVSVQELVEEAASRLAGGARVPSVTAGRTDAGVHASGLVAHLDFPPGFTLPPHRVRDGLSFHLKPHPVAALDAAPVPPDWNARFSATSREYRYTILNRPTRPALLERRVWHVKHPLDDAAMAQGAALLLGRHDFSSFRAAACQAKNPLRTLDALDVSRRGELIVIGTRARSFLHHQVRNMVGSLVLVGAGKWKPERMGEVLAARDRGKAGPTAPPDGLCLTGVGYPEDPFSEPLQENRSTSAL